MTKSKQRYSPPPQQSDVAHAHDILDVVEHELIPRLLMLDLGAPNDQGRGHSDRFIPGHEAPHQASSALAQQLALLTLDGSLADCERYLQDLRDGGLGLETIFLEVLQPAARLLGSRWKEDSCSFVDVTTGLWLLQQIFHRLLHDFQSEPADPRLPSQTSAQPRPSAFFCTPPGAQHRLGVQMVSAFFCRAGWQTGLSFGETLGQICDEAKRYAPDLLGVSLSCEQEMLDAPAFILSLKQATSKTTPIIMIGGPGPSLFPELAIACKADFISGDAPEALSAAQAQLQRRRGQASA
jgi:methanogenic corrinoid protein MtbC1